MKNRYAYAMMSLAFGLCAFVCMSCEDDEASRLPVFSELKVTPDMAYPGSTVQIEAVQASRGHLIYKAVYSWTITVPGGGANDEVRKRETVVYDSDSKNPTFTYEVPADAPEGGYSVNFQAEYHYSAGKVDAPAGGRGVTVVQNSSLYGIMQGNKSFRVFAKANEE